MTDKELKELTARHFAPFRNLTWYHVCRDCDEPCVYTEKEWDEMFEFLRSHNCLNCVEEILSPLSKADFKKLALYQADNEDFWTEAVLHENGDFFDDEC